MATMFIAMNIFRVHAHRRDDFVRAWKNRDSFLNGVPGFQSFHLLEGQEQDGVCDYASHTVWRDETSFREWLDSEAFHKAHAQGKLSGMLEGPPKFMGWTALPID